MKRYITISALFVALLLGSPVHAQTVDTPTDNPTVVALLQQIIALLEQELSIIQAGQISQPPTVSVQPVTQPVIAKSSSPTLPDCATTRGGSVSATNCVVITPSVAIAGTVTTFTITASPYTFLPLQNMPDYSLSSDASTITYTTFVPPLSPNGTPENVVISLNNGLVDSNGKEIPITHPFYIPVIGQ